MWRVEQGAVEVEWEADEKDLRLQWREAGGPATKPPEKHGYGARLVKATIEQLGGTIEYDWRPEGLIMRLRLPIASLDG
jgi:two-component sensor histidine kinase